MNTVNVSLSLVEASLVLSALRQVSMSVNMPQLENAIAEIHAAYRDAEDATIAESEPDQFRTDAEADADALASAGMGTDEDYGGPAEDAGLDDYWESQTELGDC